jgi:hypothetical protein
MDENAIWLRCLLLCRCLFRDLATAIVHAAAVTCCIRLLTSYFEELIDQEENHINDGKPLKGRQFWGVCNGNAA